MPLSSDIKNLPELPGVYRYYDCDGRLLYIGKAKNIRKRVSSYFIKTTGLPARTRLMVKQIHQIEFITVSSEKDAFLLENALIKEYQPKYNIELKDDKSYPYIVIVNEPFPRIFLTRNPKKDGSEHFGPFTSVHQVRAMLELIKKIYPIRSCSLNLSARSIQSKNYKVCLEYHIGNCLGPCAGLQSKEIYDHNIAHIRSMIKGNLGIVKQALQTEMQEHAVQLRFEEAASVKKQLSFLSQYVATSAIVNPKQGNLEVFGYAEDQQRAFVHYFRIVEGTIVKVRSLLLQKKLEETPEDILAHGILEILGSNLNGQQIIVPFDIPFIAESVQTIIPKAGEKKKLLDLAQRNATEQKIKYTPTVKKVPASVRLLEQMKEDLRMLVLPEHIECFDNSNLQGSNPVAAMVVFRNGKPSVKEYRTFNIKTVTGPDDFASMKEVVGRRYKRVLEDGQELPQLIVIDGGKGQLSAACEALDTLGLSGRVQIISIAKRLEEIYYPGDSFPLHISKKSETLKVLQHLRNEAHRFAITFHRKKRNISALKTNLTEIAGIGKKTADALLITFRSEKKIREASLEQLSAIVGNDKARKVFQALSAQA
jgi:excinuclease ABC subunit C